MDNRKIKYSYCVAPAPEGYHVGLTGDFEKNVAYLAELGYDGVELALRDINSVDAKDILRVTDKYGFGIPSMLGTGRFMSEQGLILSDEDEGIRRRAIEALKEIIRFSGELGSKAMVGMSVGRYNENTFEETFKRLADSLHECGEYAATVGGGITIEALDRFFPSMIIKVDDGVRLMKTINLPTVSLNLDTMHMIYEEPSVADGFRRAKGYVGHIHIADTDRQAPGQGEMNMREIMDSIVEIGYEGYISAELSSKVDQVEGAVLTMNFFKEMFPE